MTNEEAINLFCFSDWIQCLKMPKADLERIVEAMSIVGKICINQSAHIDREAWEPCEDCKPHCAICENYGGWDRYGKPKVCEDCKDHSNFQADDRFCSYCGRPLAEEAWSDLEKRFRG